MMRDQRKNAIESALRYAQSVRDWAAAEGYLDGAEKIALETARIGAYEAYGTRLDWSFGGQRASVPVLDSSLTAMLFCPSVRTCSEADFRKPPENAGVLDLVGDALTLCLALSHKDSLVLAGEGKALGLWREVLSHAAPQSTVTFLDLACPGEQSPSSVNWVRCVKLSHWLDFASRLPVTWRKIAPVIICIPDEVAPPRGWKQVLLTQEGHETLVLEQAVLRVLTPPNPDCDQ